MAMTCDVFFFCKSGGLCSSMAGVDAPCFLGSSWACPCLGFEPEICWLGALVGGCGRARSISSASCEGRRTIHTIHYT